jgi:hypothetical protein
MRQKLRRSKDEWENFTSGSINMCATLSLQKNDLIHLYIYTLIQPQRFGDNNNGALFLITSFLAIY